MPRLQPVSCVNKPPLQIAGCDLSLVSAHSDKTLELRHRRHLDRHGERDIEEGHRSERDDLLLHGHLLAAVPPRRFCSIS